MSNKTKYILIAAGILLVILLIYLMGRKAGKNYVQPLNLPTGGQGIPQGWSAIPTVTTIRNAMGSDSWWDVSGWGTDENAILNSFTPLTKDQIRAVIVEYQNQYKEDLVKRLEGELSGVYLSSVMALIQGSNT